jgi:hypothetical protein
MMMMTKSSSPHKKGMMEIARETMMQRLGAPPVWKANQKLEDNSQVRNRHPERTEKHHDGPPVKYIQFPSQHCTYEPFIEAIKIPFQFSGDRSFKSQQMTVTEESKGVLPGKHKKRVHQRASLSFNGSPFTPPKRKSLRATKSFDEHDFVDNLGRPRVSYKNSKDNDKSVTASAEPRTTQRVKNALTPRSVHTQSSADQDIKPKEAKDLLFVRATNPQKLLAHQQQTQVSQGSQQKLPQLSSEMTGVHSAFGSRPKLDARTRPNQKVAVVYITRAR